jgi:hypothetical protein
MEHRFLISIICFALIFSGCNPNYEEPETAIDAGRQYIQAIYQGNFKRANQLIGVDDASKTYLEEIVEKDFRSRNSAQKERLSQSSIQIVQVKAVNEERTLLFFTNAYTNKEDSVRLEKINEKWVVLPNHEK